MPVSRATLSWTGPEGSDDKEIELGDRFGRRDVKIGATIRTLKIRSMRSTRAASLPMRTSPRLPLTSVGRRTRPMLRPSRPRSAARVASKGRDAAVGALESALESALNGVEYSANFRTIGGIAARGPAYLVPIVQAVVPPGYRLSMLPFNEDAVVALGQLKDANAIPYLHTAAAGAARRRSQWLLRGVALFELRPSSAGAYVLRSQLGQYGNGEGGLKSLTMSIATDSQGNVWVADTGNNRVQRLASMGTGDLVLGGDKAIATSWFGDESKPYASGSKPGREPGQFMQPMFVAVGNYDNLMVIDSDLRVQTFDPDGKPIAQWQIDTRWRPRAGSGNGTPIITWLDDYYIIVRDEVWVYNVDGEKKNQYTLEGGEVQAAVIAAKGKLLVRHVGSWDITEYKPKDGFKQGSWIKKGLPEVALRTGTWRPTPRTRCTSRRTPGRSTTTTSAASSSVGSRSSRIRKTSPESPYSTPLSSFRRRTRSFATCGRKACLLALRRPRGVGTAEPPPSGWRLCCFWHCLRARARGTTQSPRAATTTAATEPKSTGPSAQAAENSSSVEPRSGPKVGEAARQAAVQILSAVVNREAGNPKNAWALAHGMLAMGPEFKATDGRRALDVLGSDFLERDAFGPRFALKRDGRPVEPHQDLILKTLLELGFGLEE